MILAAMLAASTTSLETQIQRLYALIIFTIPLVVGIGIAVAYGIVRIQQAWTQAHVNTAWLQHEVSPAIATMQQSVNELHAEVKQSNGNGNGSSETTSTTQ